MFGFAKKAFKKASNTVTHAVTRTPIVGDAVRAMPGRGFIRAGALLAAPGPVLSTSYSVKHPLRAGALVASAGAAAPALHGRGAVEVAGKTPAILSRGRSGDATRLVPALGAASKLVAATRNRRTRPAAIQAILKTRRLAQAGHHQARVGLTMLQIAAQARSLARLGRVRIGGHYVTRFGRITRAA